MKKIIQLICVIIISSLCYHSLGQSYEYEIKLTEFTQSSETEFSFVVYLKKSSSSNLIGVENIQFQLNYNSQILNGGSFISSFLTVDASETDFVGQVAAITDPLFVTDGTNITFASSSAGAPGSQVTVLDDNWKRLAGFNVELSFAGSPHNYTSAHPELKFRNDPSIIYTVLNRCDFTGTSPNYTKDGTFSQQVNNRILTPDYTTYLETRELASYCFTGEGSFGNSTRWNNTTTLNSNSLPPAGTNILIAGAATISDSRDLNQITVKDGAYLVLSDMAELTTDQLYNDNTGNTGQGNETMLEWNFEDLTQNSFPYTADFISTTYNGLAQFQGFSAFPSLLIYDSGNRVTSGTGWSTSNYWQIEINSLGYSDILISSKQKNYNGSTPFRLQYSLDNLNFTDIPGTDIQSTSTWTSLSQIPLPVEVENNSTLYLRWSYYLSGINFSESFIDDIIVEGTPQPTGILIKSTASGTGSLIHNTTGVHAKVERYIEGAEWTSWSDGWHLLSSPVADQTIDPAFTTIPDTEYDFYTYCEPSNCWVNYKGTNVGTTWLEINNNSLDFQVGKGYLVSYAQTDTKLFEGVLNVEDVTITGICCTGSTAAYRSWNLVGNPYTCAIKWYNGCSTNNIAGVAQIWNEEGESYTPIPIDGIIPASQGFMVCATASTGSLTIPASNRQHTSPNFMKTQSHPVIKLFAHNIDNPSFQESQIHINPASTIGFDTEFDCDFMQGYAPSFYSVQGNDSLCVNSIPLLTEQTVIPFTFIKNEGTNFKIIAEDLGTIQSTVFLLDKKLNIDHNLSLNPIYTFTATTSDNSDRFELHFTNLLVGNDSFTADATINIYTEDKMVHFEFNELGDREINIYNIAGQIVAKKHSIDIHTVVDVSSLNSGIYLANIYESGSMFSKKFYLNN